MSRSSLIYRPRNSTIHRRRSTTLHQDPFPLLDFKEISICLQSCEFTATEELVTRPTSQFMKTLTEQLLDAFMGISGANLERRVEAISKAGARKAQQEMEDKENDDTTSSLGIIVLYRSATEFYRVCGVDDFSLMDIMKPDPQRIRRILSAVVNFARFREENSVDCEELVTISEANLEKVKKIEFDNTALSNKINELKQQLESGNENQQASLKQINAYNSKLETELKKLKHQQEQLTFEHSQYKNEKSRLIEKLEDNNYLIMEATKELEKLKDYNQIDTALVSRIIEDLKVTLHEYQETFNRLDSQNRNLVITIESFQLVEQELKNLFRILEEIIHDLTKEEDIAERLTKYQEFLDQQKLESSDLNRRIQLVKRQLSTLDDKIARLKTQSAEKSEQSRKKLADLKVDYDKLVEERNIKEQELDKRKEMINELETKMSTIESEYQTELKNSELAVAKLNTHLRLYLSEMRKKI